MTIDGSNPSTEASKIENKDVALALLNAGRHAEALDALSNVYLDFKKDLILVLRKVDAQIRVGRLTEAIDILLAALDAGIRDIRIYLELARARNLQSDVEGAIEWYTRASVVQPRNIWPYFRLGKIHRKRHNYAAEVEILSAGAKTCKGYVIKEELTNCLKDLCEARALLALQNRGALGQLSSLRSPPGRALDRTIHVSLVKDEADIIYAALDASYRNGLRRFILADNGSRDGTRKEIDRFTKDHSDCCVFVVSDPIAQHYQSAKIMGLVSLAEGIFKALGSPIDWVFPMDGDEILSNEDQNTDLYEIVSRANELDKKLIVYLWCRASSPTVYEEIPSGLSLDELFPIITSFESNPVRKVAFRLSDTISIEEGNHFAEGIDDQDQILVGPEYGLHMLHYAVRSVSQVKSKILKSGSALQGTVGLERVGTHWRQDSQAYAEQGDDFVREKVRKYVESNAARLVQATRRLLPH